MVYRQGGHLPHAHKTSLLGLARSRRAWCAAPSILAFGAVSGPTTSKDQCAPCSIRAPHYPVKKCLSLTCRDSWQCTGTSLTARQRSTCVPKRKTTRQGSNRKGSSV